MLTYLLHPILLLLLLLFPLLPSPSSCSSPSSPPQVWSIDGGLDEYRKMVEKEMVLS